MVAPERVQRINHVINDVVKDEVVRKSLAELGFDAFCGFSEEFRRFIQKQYYLWEKLVKVTNLYVQ